MSDEDRRIESAKFEGEMRSFMMEIRAHMVTDKEEHKDMEKRLAALEKFRAVWLAIAGAMGLGGGIAGKHLS